jgi:hypothetical protein
MRLCDLVENFTGDTAGSEWEPRDGDDSISLAIVHDIVPLAVCETVAVLDRNDRDDPVSPLNMFLSDVGDGDHANLPPDASVRLMFQPKHQTKQHCR